MKQIIILTLLLAFTAVSFSQQIVQKKSLTKIDYLQKSKKQKTVAWILLGGGIGLIAITAAIPSEVTDYGNPFDPFDDKYSNSWDLLAIPGALGILGSIPFFIVSGKNKRSANAVSFSIKRERASLARANSITNINYPALSLKLVIK